MYWGLILRERKRKREIGYVMRNLMLNDFIFYELLLLVFFNQNILIKDYTIVIIIIER